MTSNSLNMLKISSRSPKLKLTEPTNSSHRSARSSKRLSNTPGLANANSENTIKLMKSQSGKNTGKKHRHSESTMKALSPAVPKEKTKSPTLNRLIIQTKKTLVKGPETKGKTEARRVRRIKTRVKSPAR